MNKMLRHPERIWETRSLGAEADLIAAETSPASFRRIATPEPPAMDPAVYFVEAVGTQLVKIGVVLKVSNLQRRMEQLQSGCPFRLRVAFLLDGAGRKEEARLHRALDAYRHDREWFRREGLLDEILTAVKEDEDRAIEISLRAIA